MLADYVARGLVAGLAAGLAFAAFVALVGNPLVAGTEAVASAGGGAHDHAAAVPGAVANAVGVASGVGLGLLFGAGFGVAYFFFEPVLPGGAGARSYLLGAAGFVIVSGAPWLALPPRPAGVEAALPADVRLAWYGGMMGLGALACGLAGYTYRRVDRARGTPLALAAAALPFALLAVPAALAPVTPGHGAVPDALVAAFRGVVLFGQVGLWAVLAGAHAWLCRRDAPAAPAGIPPASAD